MKIKSIFSLRKWVGLFLTTKCGKSLNDERFIRLKYYASMGKILHLKNPVTFNEKLQWLKLYDRNPAYTQMVDKYAAKEYVANIIGKEYIIPNYGVWEKPEEIDFDSLPDQFVLKVTHDSGGLVICRDKSKLNREHVVEKLNKSLQRDYYIQSREWPYKNVKKQIIAEVYMEDEQSGHGLTDYKFFCFNGIPRFLYVSQGLEDHTTAKISFFDFEGKRLPFSRSDYRPFEKNIELPKQFEKMIEIAKVLANEVANSFVRIDLYSINGDIYFSEITFFPCGGMVPFDPPEWDKKMGEWIELPID